MKRLFKIGLFAAILVTFTGTLHAEEGLEEVWYNERTTDGSEYGRAVAATPDGGYVVAGQTSASLPNQSVRGFTDGFVTKYNSLGKIEWQKLYGTEGNDELWDIIPTSDGGYLAAGYTLVTRDTTHGDGFLVKIDANGNEEWQYKTSYTSFDIFHKVVELDDGTYLATGEGSSKVNIVKVDKNGNLVSENYHNIEDGSANNFSDSTITTRGTVLIAGSLDGASAAPGRVVFVVEVDKSGNVLSSKLYPSATRNFANFTSISATSDGGFIYSAVEIKINAEGVRTDYSVVVKCDSNGDVEWESEYEGFSIHDTFVNTNGYVYVARAGTFPDYGAKVITANLDGTHKATYDVLNSEGKEVYGSAVKSSDSSYILSWTMNGEEFAMKFKITSEEDTIVTPPVDGNQGQNNNQNQGSNQTQNGVNTTNSGGNTTSSSAIAPATGDNTNVVLLMSLMLLSVLTINKLKVKKY